MERISALIDGLGPERLQLLSPDLRRQINSFFPKKRRELLHRLDQRLMHDFSSKPAPADAVPPARRLREDYASRLDRLRDHHIFQWNTHYDATLGYILKDLIQRIELADSPDELLEVASEELRRHSLDIFGRGFGYITQQQGFSESVAQLKSLSGLQSFLLLLVQAHTSLTTNVRDSAGARALRDTCSALLTGVLRGYAESTLGATTGWDILVSNFRSWGHTLAFLRGSHLQTFLDRPDADTTLSLGLRHTLLPVALGIDRFFNRRTGTTFLYTRLSRLSVNPYRLEFSLALPARANRHSLTILCYLADPLDSRRYIDDPLAAGVSLVCLPMAPELRAPFEGILDENLLDTTLVGHSDQHIQSFADATLSLLERHLDSTLSTASDALRPIHNYARDFPLADPVLRQFYLVRRHSVQGLLEQFEQGTGTHIWCSVRRSGKTTAAGHLAGLCGHSVVTIQSMDQQPHQPELNLFSQRIVDAVQDGRSLPLDFFREVVKDCAAATSPTDPSVPKRVFVIDEYESLFGHLNAAVENDDMLRYTVVQPLLSQMVAFSIENLLILLGQRPDAHRIVMSQNQLSPLVQQDAFPLFHHEVNVTGTEFTQFVSRVLTDKLPFAPSFADALYAVTAGHPYLTVNVLVDFCQWLIENNAQAGAVDLTGAELHAFSQERLTLPALRGSPHYGFFQGILAEYLSEKARAQEPWLYAVTTVLQRLCREHPRALATSIPKYCELAKDVAPLAGLTVEQLLTTASLANFLTRSGGRVRPAIPVMGRLAAAAVSEIN